MRLLVCGGAGFIGSAFVRRMLAKHPDWEIVCFDKLTYAGNLENLRRLPTTRATASCSGDICDRAAVRRGHRGRRRRRRDRELRRRDPR